MKSVNDIDLWKRSITPDKTIIRLKDEETIKRALAAKTHDAINGVDYKVTSIQRIDGGNGLEWRLISLEDKAYLLVKIVDNIFDIRVMYSKDDENFTPGTRRDLLNNDLYFLFSEPDDPEDFVPSDLDFAEYIIVDFADGGEVEYKKGLTVHGTANYSPVRDGENGEFVSIISYDSEEETLYDSVLIIEAGGINLEDDDSDFEDYEDEDVEIKFSDEGPALQEQGGFVELYYGYDITDTILDDLEVL